MPCYHPLTAYESNTLKANGRKLVKFKKPDDLHKHKKIQLPCSQCIGCRLDRSITWAARCMHEAQMHEESAFITLTYAELPQYGSLTPPHFVKFMKRYRNSIRPRKIRFFHGAEYGDNLGRPHHHACIFGHDFSDKEIFSECEGIYTYYSPTLENLWGHGFCTTTELTLQSAAYVARYCLKKINGKNQNEHYQTTDPYTGEIQIKIPEYATMSRKPGIGRDWYEKFNSDIFPHDTTIYKGKNIKTPRYYENLLRSTDEIAYTLLKETRKHNAQKHAADNTPARLLVREKVKIYSMKDLQRKLHNDT